MPGYDLSPAADGMLPWEWAVTRLASSQRFWLATASADGRPHLAALWAVWHDERLWFSTGSRSRKARDLAARPSCSLSVEGAAESVVVDGWATMCNSVSATVAAAYAEKYGAPPPPGEPVFSFVPKKAIAVVEAAEQFQGTATRWTFDS